MEFYVGCSGWSYPHWEGKFYPDCLARNQWLAFYVQHFNTVEVNMSFYRFPFPNMVKSWNTRTPDDFCFTFKANRLITHMKKFRDTDDLVARFLDVLAVLEGKIGCILWQLPPSMHMSEENLERLEGFFSKLKGHKAANVVEFRHKSWWCKETYQMLKRNNLTFCVVDYPLLPDDVLVTSEVLYVRFHGAKDRYRHNYTDEELKAWAAKIKEVKGCKEVYCYFNNDFEAHAPQNALSLMKIIGV